MNMPIKTLTLCSLALAAQNLMAFDVRVTVQNNAATDGLYFTPVWTGFHDGTFDAFDSGSVASAGIEAVAEGGDTSVLNATFGSASGRVSNTLASGSGIGPGLFDPSRSASMDITLDTALNRYFSFASMILPSNDAFFANDAGNAYELFDGMGAFNGPITIQIFGADLYDAGTEENDTFGAPFSLVGGMSTDTVGGAIGSHTGLDNFVGTTLGNSTVLGQAFVAGTPIATITLTAVPEPATYAGIAGLLVLGVAMCRRRK